MLAGATAIVLLERRRPLRTRTEPAAPRTGRNLVLAGITAAVIRLTEQPLTARLARWVDARSVGALPALRLPRPLEYLIAIVLLDYTLYWWHIGLHRVPALWRMHVVHHVDGDLDASTALRFHFAEMLASLPFRGAQIVAIGVRPAALRAWQALTIAEVVLHHSNVRLPLALERAVGRFVVTPRLHGIHHANDADIAASNYSSGLTVWDRLHGTLRDDVPQSSITIGVEGYGDAAALRVPELIALPLERLRAGRHA